MDFGFVVDNRLICWWSEHDDDDDGNGDFLIEKHREEWKDDVVTVLDMFVCLLVMVFCRL